MDIIKKSNKKNMETLTKKNEVITTVESEKDLRQALGKFTHKRILKTWEEDFIDEETGEAIAIERNEVLFEKGIEISNEIATQISFHFQSGDITKGIEISNQKRLGFEYDEGEKIYFVVIEIGSKKKRFLLTAKSVHIAIEIVKDYVEINFSQGYRITSIKEFKTDIIIDDKLVDTNEDDDTEEDRDKFYQITVFVINENEYESKINAVVRCGKLDKAIILLKNHLESLGEGEDIEIRLEESKVINVTHVIEDEFLLAYQEEIKK